MVQTSFGSGGELVYKVSVDTSGVNFEVSTLLDKFTKLEQVALRYLAIARRTGLPDDIQKAVDAIARLITILNQVRLTWGLLQAEMGPAGWALFAASGIFTALTVGDTLAGY